jgi:hypothetical protein
MQIRRQGAHRSDLFGSRADDLGHGRGGLLGEQLPLAEGRVLEVGEVTAHADGRPGVQMGLEIPGHSLGLQPE